MASTLKQNISLSSSEEEPESELSPILKKRKKNYAQNYNPKWEEDSKFKGWLTKSTKGTTYCYCKACNKNFLCGKSEIEKHANGKKHLLNARGIARQQTLIEMPTLQQRITKQQNIKRAEIRLAVFAVEHNISFNTLDHLTKLNQEIYPDSEIAKDVTCGRTKATAIVNNVTGKYCFENLLTLLRKTQFSLIVDESTDRGDIKHLAMVVRLFDYRVNKIVDLFLGLLQVPSATAEALYTEISKFFSEYNIPFKENMIGFAADGASVMMGVHQSLSVLLKNDIPDLFIMRCICHSFALCASYACEKLPSKVEGTARDIYSFLKYSFKRQSDLTEFQNFVEIKPHKILHPSQTRWLSLLSVVKRLLEQFNALVLYFTNAHLVDKIPAAENILTRLRDPSFRLYLEFLDFVLPLFNNLTVEMQAETIKIHVLYQRVETIIKTIMGCYLKREYISSTKIENIDIKSPHNFQKIEDIYLGAIVVGKIQNNMHNLTDSELLIFRKRCLGFLIEGCEQIYKRFNFKHKSQIILNQLSMIDPKSVIMKKYPSVAPLALLFPNLVKQSALNDLDREWREIQNIELSESENTPILEFWDKISKMKTGDDKPSYSNISKFVFNLLCLPHSSATVERIFSQVNLNKTKIRNRLQTKTLTGILHTKNLTKHSNCFDFKIDTELVAKLNNQIYDN